MDNSGAPPPSRPAFYQQYVEKIEVYLNGDNKLAHYLGIAEKKTGLRKIYFVYMSMGFLFLYLMLGYGGQFLTNMVGIIYPAYASIKAVESDTKDDDTQWLIYWVVFSAFNLAEFFGNILFFWVPFYWLTKCIFLLWLMYPGEQNGSLFLYYRFIRPVALKHQDDVDRQFNQLKDMASEAFATARERAANEASARAAKESPNIVSGVISSNLDTFTDDFAVEDFSSEDPKTK